jgi:microcystin-dependent protein
MSFTKEERSWFFRATAPLNLEGKKINLQNGSRPDQDLFERFTASHANFKEAGDRAKLSTGGAYENEVGLVTIAPDTDVVNAGVYVGNTGLAADRTKVVHAAQLSTVDATESQTVGALTDNLVEVTVDGAVTTRNNFLLRLKESFRAWLDTLRSDVDTNTTNITTLTTSIGDAVPVGTVTQFFGNSAPTGWLLLDGTTIGSAASGAGSASDDYEDLFNQLWDNSAQTELIVSSGRGGGAGADWAANKTIELPNFVGKTPIGKDSGDSDYDALAKEGGAKDVALVANNMPDHTHDGTGSGTTGSGGNAHSHAQQMILNGSLTTQHMKWVSFANKSYPSIPTGTQTIYLPNGVASQTTDVETDTHTHNFSGISTGNVTGGAGGTNVDIVNPFSTINFIIKY